MKNFFILLVLLHAVISWYKIITTTAPDFTVYYYSTQRLVEGLPIYGSTGLFTGLGYPPQSLLFYLPFIVLPYSISQGLWITLSFLLLPVIVWLTLKLLDKKTSLLLIFLISSLFFFSFPTKFTLGMGQVNLLALVFVLLSFYIKHPIYSGICFGLSVLVKPQLVFLGILFLMFKRWKMLQWAVLVNCVMVVMTIVFFGGDEVMRYIMVETKSLSAYVERGIYYNQGISGFLSRILPDQLASVGVHLIRFFILGVTFFSLQKKKISFIDAGFLSLVSIVLLLPVSWQHHFVFLFPVVMWVSTRMKSLAQYLGLTVSILLMSWNIKQPQEVIILPSIILSHGFLGMVLLWVLTLQSFQKRT